MTIRELICQEWKITEAELERLISLAQDNQSYNRQLADEWNRQVRKTSEEINDFYNDNLLYSIHMIHKLPLDSELSSAIFIADTRVSELLLDIPPVSHLLDYGSGFGNNGLWAFQRGFNVICADIDSPHARILETICRRIDNPRLSFHLLPGKFIRLVDVIVCSQVMEHLPNPIKVLKLFHKLLIQGGLLVLDCFFDDCGGRAPYHLRNNNVFGDTAYWHRCIETVGFKPFKNYVWKK